MIPVPEVNKYGTPVLKSIFYTAMSYSSHSRFHGFSNGDILFTEGRGHLYFIHISIPPYTSMNYSLHSHFHGFCNGDILFTEGRGHLYFIHFFLPPPLHMAGEVVPGLYMAMNRVASRGFVMGISCLQKVYISYNPFTSL